MSDKGCCCFLPSWVATIPGWIIAFVVPILMFGNFTGDDQMFFIIFATVNLVPYVLSAILKEQVWPRVILMLCYIVVSGHISVFMYVASIVAGSETCRNDPDRCAPFRYRAIFICASWSILQIFIWIGLGYFIKSAHDAKNKDMVTHPYQRV